MKKKNVLFIVVDDLRPQLGCYGMPWVHSPNIDRLAQDSLLLERAYCQQAVCAPSRCSVLSGCRPDTTNIYGLMTPLRKAMPEVRTLPEHFKKNGYETLSIGKVYHHGEDDLQGWSKPPSVARGDWKGRGYLTDEALEAIAKSNAEMEAAGDHRRGLGPAFEAADVADDAYHDGKEADKAVAELQRLSHLNRPFFMALGFHKPHLPFNAPKRYWDMYDPDKLPLAENPWEPEGKTEFSLTNYGELRGYFGIPKEGDIPEDFARRLIHGYCACVSYVDAQIGKVIDELKRQGLWDNTVIAFWGDHGWKLGEHNSWCKHTNFEVDTRAPLMTRSPDMAASGAHSSALVEFVDIYPTLCELCDIEIPKHCEGTSFVPLLNDPSRPWKTAAFSQYPRSSPSGDAKQASLADGYNDVSDVMGYAMRTERYRYVEWKETATHTILARELYDHAGDEQENINIAGSVEADLLETLSEQLRRGWKHAKPPQG